MNTAKLIPTPIVAPAGAMRWETQTRPANRPPWLEEAVEPFAMPPRRLPRRVRPARRPSLEVEMIHWSVGALTLLTAVSVLFGAFGGTDSNPQELLPIMITTPAR